MKNRTTQRVPFDDIDEDLFRKFFSEVDEKLVNRLAWMSIRNKSDFHNQTFRTFNELWEDEYIRKSIKEFLLIREKGRLTNYDVRIQHLKEIYDINKCGFEKLWM